MLSFLCLRCKKRISYKPNQEKFSCSCGMSYPVIDNIPVLAENPTYYGEIPKEKKAMLLEKMDKGLGWRKAVWDNFAQSYPFLHHIIVDETRNDFRYLLPVDKNSVVLDLGVGWGTMSCHFAYSAKEVIALDGTLDRCQFVRKRCMQDGIDNVTPVCADILSEPFPEASFDIVLMNGVLEWIGKKDEPGDPKERQLAALKTVKKMLKDDGILYIGIENSHGFKYILGEMDDHTGIYHISYLEREKANEKALNELKRPYDTYTYDQKGYEELLCEAGFENSSFFYPIPDYKSANYILPLENANLLTYFHSDINSPKEANSLTERVRSLETRAARRGHAADYAASYSIIAGNSTKKGMNGLVADYIKHNWQDFLDTKPSHLHLLQLSGATGKKFEKGRIKYLAFCDDDSNPSVCVTFCRSKEYEESLTREYNVCTTLKSGLPFHLNTNLKLVDIAGYSVLLCKAVHATPLSFRLAQKRYCAGFSEDSIKSQVKSDFKRALTCLKALHEKTSQKSSSWPDIPQRIIKNAGDAYGEKMKARAADIIESISPIQEGRKSCLVHGDFTPWNLLAAKSPNEGDTIIIDWELSHTSPMTILDYGRFAYYYMVEMEKLGIFTGPREDTLKRIFITGEHWFAGIAQTFLLDGLAGIAQNRQQASMLMQFMLMCDAVTQSEFSMTPTEQIGRHYLKMIEAFDE